MVDRCQQSPQTSSRRAVYDQAEEPSHPAAGFFKTLRGLGEDTLGVSIRTRNGSLIIDLHIIVTYGINISAIVNSIMHKVSYTVEEVTGIPVEHVNVFVDGMKSE